MSNSPETVTKQQIDLNSALLFFSEEVVLTKNWLRGDRLIMFAAGLTILITITFAVSGFSYTRYRSKSSRSMRNRKRKRKDKFDAEDRDTDKLISAVSEDVEMPSGISDSATMLAYNEVLVHPSPPVHTKVYQVTAHPDNTAGVETKRKLSKNTTTPSRRNSMTVLGAEGGEEGPSESQCLVYSDRKYLTLDVSQLTVANSNARGTDIEDGNNDSSLSFF